MEFGLLGPLLVRAGESPVQVSAGKQRVLMAALLLRANEVVCSTDLAAAVWQGSPPGSARVTLQNYIKRLRHALEPAGRERIVTRPSGYLIEVRPGELDVARFTQLHEAGLTAARAGAWPDAADRLVAALQVWRGQPLADVPSPALVLTEGQRLAELRLGALEARIDAELHLGRHRELVAELEALAEAEPLRERVHELLMLALYRSGQQAAALAAFGNTRRQLVDGLGIEPGPALHELSRRILQDDRSLLLPRQRARGSLRGAQPSGGVPRPMMLPAEVPGFTGRAAELAAMSEMLPGPGNGAGPVITVIGGTAGVGKTALAVHWARQHAADFPGGQLYINLHGFGPGDALPPADALRIFLDALAGAAAQVPATLAGRQSLYRSRLARAKALIVLDNAGDPDQVRPLLPGSPGCLVIVTSRNELTGLIAADGAQAIALDVLTDDEAQQMLAHRLGPHRVAAEPAAVAELVRVCARLPLALAVAAARSATRPDFTLAALAAELRDTSGRLDALTTGEDVTDVRAVFSWSYDQLSPAAARMFRLLGLHPGPDITSPAAASLAGATTAEGRRMLRELTRHHLLTERAPGRYTVHDLLRAYATEQAHSTDTEIDRRAAIGRMLDHYLHTAHAAALLLLSPSREPIPLTPPCPGVTAEHPAGHQQALAWFDAERQALVAAVALAAGLGFDSHAWQLAWAMTDFLDRHGHWDEWAAIQCTALEAAIRLGDTAAQAVIRRLLAVACARLAEYDQARAHLTDCLEHYQRLGDRVGEAHAHQALSWVAEQQDRHADALSHAEQAFRVFQATGHLAGQANMLNAIGWNHARLGDHQQARSFCRQALALHRETGNRFQEAHTWDSLGYAEHHLGRHAQAADCYARALGIFAELGDRYYQAIILTHLGDTRHASGDPQRARDAWQRALATLDDLHHPDAERVRAKLTTADDNAGREPAGAGSASGQQ